MPGEGRRGRRDNGLDAVAYVPLLDVDPRVGEHLLDVLGSAGVPAFLEPSADVEPYTRTLSLPSPPTDRLWVDRDQRRQARLIVEAETPHGARPQPSSRDDEPSHGLSDEEEERAWQAIVAGFDAPPTDRGPTDRGPTDRGPTDRGPTDRGQIDRGPTDAPGDPTGTATDFAAPADAPAEADPDERSTRTGEGDATTWRLSTGWDPGWDRPLPQRDRDDLIADPWSDAEAERGRRRRTRGGPADTDPLPSGKDLDAAAEARGRQEEDAARDAERAADDLWIDGPPSLDADEEHFEPPPPPPVPRPTKATVVAILLVALGILLMAAPRVVGMDDRSGLTIGVLCVLGAGALLIWRLREARDDDGPDDGAIV